MKKQELRKIYKQKRLDLTLQDIKKLQENVYKQIAELDFSAYQNIHVFLPIEKQKEIDTLPIIKHLQLQKKIIVVSKSNFANNTLQHFILDKNTVLKVNSYGIPEPENATEIDVKEIDLVFVPLLISDEQNYRVGYGKGFYDRFLSNCKKDIKTIGLNFFPPIQQIEDINEYDIPLDEIIYPN